MKASLPMCSQVIACARFAAYPRCKASRQRLFERIEMAELWTSESRKKLATWADILAVAIAVSLPWSTSVTGILVGVWFFTLLPFLRWDEIRREILTSA